MKRKLLYFPMLCFMAWAFTACSRFIAPPYTSVSEISNIKKGMDLSQVNATLGIEPYDIYTIQADGSTVLVYNYRLKDRNWAVSGDYTKAVHSQQSQKAGSEWYSDKTSQVYILFQNDKVASLITDAGREDAENILITNNNIQLISKDQLVSLQEEDDVMIMGQNGETKTISTSKSIGKSKSVKVFPLHNAKKDKSGSILPEKKKSGTGKILGAILIPIILIGLLAGA